MRVPYDRPEPRWVLPGEYPRWEEALAVVNRDLAATLPEQPPLALLALSRWGDDMPESVYVAAANGEWHGNQLEPASAEDPVLALATVADAAQETVVELLWQAWPLCTRHDLGMHPRQEDGRVAWWCTGAGRPRPGPAHLRAAVGELDALVRPHRPNRKRRR
jgi:hypothetical protein